MKKRSKTTLNLIIGYQQGGRDSEIRGKNLEQAKNP